MTRLDEGMKGHYVGCLLGGAVGDALGAPVEFMSTGEIASKYGDSGVRDFIPAYGRRGAITDDTQMTLFTAEGLIRGYVRLQDRGIGPSFASTVGHAYSRWLATQGLKPAAATLDGCDGWLIGNKALHHARAPGNTCLSALKSKETWEAKADNNSKGCGGVMRVAPVGLLFRHLEDDEGVALQEAFNLGCELAELTHGHPTGFLTAGVFAGLVLQLLRDASIFEALERIKPLLKARPRHAETLSAIEQAASLARDPAVAPATAIRALGEGWVAEEALAIGLYCAMWAKDFEEGVVMAVSHGGDSDSTGSIAGNLLGAAMGKGAIPQRWLDALELRGVIEEIATDMAELPTWEIGDHEGADNDRIYAKYPPN